MVIFLFITLSSMNNILRIILFFYLKLIKLNDITNFLFYVKNSYFYLYLDLFRSSIYIYIYMIRVN